MAYGPSGSIPAHLCRLGTQGSGRLGTARLCRLGTQISAGSGHKAKVTRDTAGNPGGGGARGPRRPSYRRRPHAAADHAAAERATGEPAGEDPRATGLTGPQRAFPAWDGVPGYEFEGRRASRRPSADHAGTGPQAARGPAAPEGEARRFRYTPTVSQPMPGPPSAWDEPAAPGFEFGAAAQTADPFSPGLFDADHFNEAYPDAGRLPDAGRPAKPAPARSARGALGPGGLGRGAPRPAGRSRRMGPAAPLVPARAGQAQLVRRVPVRAQLPRGGGAGDHPDRGHDGVRRRGGGHRRRERRATTARPRRRPRSASRPPPWPATRSPRPPAGGASARRSAG